MLFPYGNEFFVFICRLYVLSQWNIKTNTIIRIVHRLNIKTLCKNNIVFQVIGWIVILILVFSTYGISLNFFLDFRTAYAKKKTATIWLPF